MRSMKLTKNVMKLFTYIKKLQKHLLEKFVRLEVLAPPLGYFTVSFFKNQNLSRKKVQEYTY